MLEFGATLLRRVQGQKQDTTNRCRIENRHDAVSEKCMRCKTGYWPSCDAEPSKLTRPQGSTCFDGEVIGIRGDLQPVVRKSRTASVKR